MVLDGGRVAQRGTPAELYGAPANEFVAAFIGSPSTNLVRGVVADRVFSADGITWAAPGDVAGAATFGVRPEDLLVEPDAHGNGTIELVELLGPRYVVIVTVGPRRLTAVVEASVVAGWPTPPAPGDAVSVSVRPGRAHLFDAATGDRIVA